MYTILSNFFLFLFRKHLHYHFWSVGYFDSIFIIVCHIFSQFFGHIVCFGIVFGFGFGHGISSWIWILFRILFLLALAHHCLPSFIPLHFLLRMTAVIMRCFFLSSFCIIQKPASLWQNAANSLSSISSKLNEWKKTQPIFILSIKCHIKSNIPSSFEQKTT